MADNTPIEWTDATVNAINGCTLVSEGCRHCYAARLAATRMKSHPTRAGLARMNAAGEAKFTGEDRQNDSALLQPLKWVRPRRIFWNAHGDTFHESVPDEWIDRMFAVCALTPQHTHQILTKRPERMREYVLGLNCDGARRFVVADAAEQIANKFPIWDGHGYRLWDGYAGKVWDEKVTAVLCGTQWPLPNVHLGTSVEDQATAGLRIPELLATPAAVRFVSMEPLLGPVDLDKDGAWNDDSGASYLRAWGRNDCYSPSLDWIIVGGESGPHARPMHPDWARSIRDQCAAAGVPFHFKQWGEWGPRRSAQQNDLVDARKSLIVRPDGGITSGLMAYGADAWLLDKVGKRAAGRLLDSIEHNGMPGVQHAG